VHWHCPGLGHTRPVGDPSLHISYGSIWATKENGGYKNIAKLYDTAAKQKHHRI